MERMKNKVAVVTGAGSGIGKGIAKMFAAEGAKVAVVDFNPEWAEATLKEIKDKGGQAILSVCNLRNKDNVKKMVAEVMNTYGDLNTLVNSAGILVHKPFLEHNDDDLIKIHETNFRAYIWTMQEFLPYLIKNGPSSITNIASISVSKPETNAYFYGAYKAAVDIMTRNMIREFSPQGVRLNVICPGPVDTNLTPQQVRDNPELKKAMIAAVCPLGRSGVPEDIAYCATYLASDEAAWVTGSSFIVDGGACMMG
jgi:NAD(P)-dependent dehydrogenase (short-subunit alcohol dehydrogenase family)